MLKVFAFGRISIWSFALFGSVWLSLEAHAQSIPDASLLREKLQEKAQEEEVLPEVEEEAITSPAAIETSKITDESEPSRIEEIFSERAQTELRQFGYETFTTPSKVTLRQTGGVQDTYVLGAGDEIVVSLRGQENTQYRQRVSRNGQIILPRLAPIMAAGRTFGDFRQSLAAEVDRSFTATEAFVTLGEIRQVVALVTGEVYAPGAITVTGLSTPVDAIILAGGIKRTGSLRNVRVVRGDRSIEVDLYALIDGAVGSPAFNLQEGDRIVVPPLAHVAGVAGAVRREGIYELGPNRALSAAELITIAGGLEVRGAYNFGLLRTEDSGLRRFNRIEDLRSVVLRDGDILFVTPAVDMSVGRVSLGGHTRTGGSFSLIEKTSLQDLLYAPGQLKDAPYLMFGIVSRRDPATYVRRLMAFSPEKVMRRSENLELIDDDIVHLLGAEAVRDLAHQVAEMDLLSKERLEGDTPDKEREILNSLAADLKVDVRNVAVFLSEYLTSINGAIRVEGHYFVAPGTPLSSLIAGAGGLRRNTDLGSVEITATILDPVRSTSQTLRREISLNDNPLNAIEIQPRDAVVLREVYTERRGGQVVIRGEVRFPGGYEIMRGERLSSLIARAGGFTDAAFPLGAVFRRQAVAQREKEGNVRRADDLERLVVAQSQRKAMTAEQLGFVEKLILALRSQPTIGRISVEVDPDVLAARPDLDIELEPGDELYVPSRPSTVSVMGQVLNPGSYQYISGEKSRHYVELAGGYNELADKSRAFLVYPDGSSERLDRSFFSFGSPRVVPGTVVVVPYDLSPFYFVDFVRDAAQVVTQTTITAASVNSLTK